jgi:collagenase-like PrtC family protease
MIFVTPIRNRTELLKASELGIQEVLLPHHQLSPMGTLDTETLHSLSKEAQSLGLKPILLWDTLMRDSELNLSFHVLKQINLSQFSAIRVLDPGALELALDETVLPIQLILRSGAHNLTSILKWSNYDSRIEKVILSSELPKKRLEEYLPKMNKDVEVLGHVPTLLFYSPRHLLSYQLSDSDRTEEELHFIKATASCEESSHKGFRMIESKHGTLIFHSKDYSLIEKIEELKQMGIHSFQVDLRLEETQEKSLEQMEAVLKLCQNFNPLAFENWHQQNPYKTTRCFYQTNATDVLFKKLKNKTIQRVDSAYIGKVFETARDRHTILQIQSLKETLKPGKSIKVITPMGKIFEVKLHQMKDLDGNVLEEAHTGDFVAIPYLKSVAPSSMIYKGLDS